MARHWLKLNDEKTELMILMSKQQLSRQPTSDIQIDDRLINPQKCVKNIGVHLDQHLSMNDHISMVADSGHLKISLSRRERAIRGCEIAKRDRERAIRD